MPAFGAVLLLFLCGLGVAQSNNVDICILEHLNARALNGRVVSAHLNEESERPLAGAMVELRRIGEQDVIAKTVTDENGRFSLPNMPAGAYSLAAKSPSSYRVALFSTAVEVRLNGKKPGKQNKEIILALGWLFEGCHGGYAEVRNKSK